MTTEQYQIGYEAGYSEGFDAGAKPADGYITIPRETFDQMQRALEVLNHLDADINFLNTNELEEMVDKALAAAKAVSDEPKVKLIPTAEELGTPVQPQVEAKTVIDSDEKASAFLEKTLWGFIDVSSMFPRAKCDPRTWHHLLAVQPTVHEVEYQRVRGEAQQLAVSLWTKHYRDDAPQWTVLDDALGALSQISNMVAGMVRPQASEPAWMPIETAPKSEEVLLFATKSRPHAFIGYWGEYNRHNQPSITHWMPLPAPPKDDL